MLGVATSFDLRPVVFGFLLLWFVAGSVATGSLSFWFAGTCYRILVGGILLHVFQGV